MLSSADFVTFFSEVYGKDRNGKPIEPFPWQERLAQRACNGDWPACIALPTAAGKTACIDIAVFAMACQASLPLEKRTAPRRVFFVVDRRVVVDQTYEHAKKLAKRLAEADDGILKRVAAALKKIAGCDCSSNCTCRPLDYYALRGGMYRESTWVRSPLQPTIITTTVDQIGSRLLFRGYGVSDSLRPIHAGLVGTDALILLDEAHCSKPFEQTMTLIQKYRSWADTQLDSPFHFVSMTATPSAALSDDQIERDRDDDHAHHKLGSRIKASKPATLIVADKAKGKTWQQWGPPLIEVLADRARQLKNKGYTAVGVIVNRVATARELANELRRVEPHGKTKKSVSSREVDTSVEAILLTGRMRPIDRYALLKRLEPLFAGKSGGLEKPTFVVATQCLEVGADLDFHALVTECASLDALRQRFGRLNRVGAREQSPAVIVVRADQTEPAKNDENVDPVYGNSVANTWKWLKQNATDNVFDFGVATVRAKTQGMTPEELAVLNAPSPDAAVLLPAHLDLWCQTSPIPAPDPDPAPFLHGPSRGMPDVQIIFRSDLGDDEKQWNQIVSLCPPSSCEALPVPVSVFRRWLTGEIRTDESGDVEGEQMCDDNVANSTGRRVLRWCGPDSKDTKLITSPREVRPTDTYIVPIIDGVDFTDLGDFPDQRPTDKGDEAFQRACDRAILRLTPSVLHVPALDGVTNDDDDCEEKISQAIASLMTGDQHCWIRNAAQQLARKTNRFVKPHPLGGFVVIGKKRLRKFDPTFIEADESWESVSDQPVLLADHNRDVGRLARQFAAGCGISAHVEAIGVSGDLHDVGKADPRFQAMLHDGNRRAADLCKDKRAKSVGQMPSWEKRKLIRTRSGYPNGGRHELHSVRLAENDGRLPDDGDLRDLILHLIGSHHGHCRPFAPVIEDKTAESFSFDHNGRLLTFNPDDNTISGHGLERLDSGVAERFWKLTRRFGWWGLAWLESMVRLADWAASEAAERRSTNE